MFKAGTLWRDRLYVCTQTEILVYRLPSFERVGYVSLPSFNDVHHVRPTAEGTMLIANTGLDMVMEIAHDGRMLRQWHALGGDPSVRASRSTDYRKLPTTKPHLSHPNYVFQLGLDVWVTRFEQQDAICLTDRTRRIAIAAGKPHDGIVHGSRIYFTTVNGHVVVAEAGTGHVVRTINLNVALPRSISLGWCRGLLVLDEHRFLVAFSRLRPTKFIQNIQWAQYQLGIRKDRGHMPTRIALFDEDKGMFLWEQNLEEAGMSVVFSIHSGGEPDG
ncbi:MAG TPA: hypothetical protein VMO26_00965 [Vicinamibacterales bacterium]|nr:hypothetical protein [Vicinamibacterales bacterium]